MTELDPFAHLRVPYPCDGCDEEGATETLRLAAPLGSTCVHTHRDRACAEAARARRGGGRFYTPSEPRETIQQRAFK